jgi:hypothetical protein
MNMKLKFLAFVTIAAMSVINPANAGFYMSANKLLSLCESGSVADQNVCVGYILGVTDAAQMLDSETNMRRYCLPENVTSSQLEKTAVRYMNDNAQKLDKLASYYVLVSLRKAFPCKS